MTTSMSNRRERSIAMPMESGIINPDASISSMLNIRCPTARGGRSIAASTVNIVASVPTTATATPKTTHLVCWRSIGPETRA